MFSFLKKKPPATDDATPSKERSIQEDFEDIDPVKEYFRNETGITFEKQVKVLRSKTTSFCRLRYIPSYRQLLDDVKQDPVLKEELINYLTTNESFFYREFKQIQSFVELVKQEKQPVTILCAPSATGEEAYSIAIALLEAGVPSSQFSITGIDINSEAIEKALEARYKERNVRNLSSELQHKYFTFESDRYILDDAIKKLVTFKHTNIFSSDFPALGHFDFVFSRNMLIYFDRETKLKAKTILEKMRKTDTHPVFFGHADLL